MKGSYRAEQRAELKRLRRQQESISSQIELIELDLGIDPHKNKRVSKPHPDARQIIKAGRTWEVIDGGQQ